MAVFVVYKPADEGLLTMDGRLVVQTGGLPVKIGAVLVGGIGVGGAPSDAIDTEAPAKL